MLATTEDAGGTKPVIKGTRLGNDLGDGTPIAAAFQGIISFVIKGDIEDGAEIEIEAKEPEKPACDIAMPPDQVEIVTVTELLRIGRLVPDELETGDAATLLINGDDGFHITKVAQVVDQLAELRGRLDIASKENESAGLEVAIKTGSRGIEFIAGNADEQQLARVRGRHVP